MSMSFGCKCEVKDKSNWRVVHRNCNYSAFESPKYGKHYSDRSTVTCLKCGRTGRTKANYVSTLEDVDRNTYLKPKINLKVRK